MKLVPLDEAKDREVAIGGLYIGVNENQDWDYLIQKTALEEELEYYKKLYDFIISTGLRESGRELERYVVLFEDGKIGYFTKRRWADIMCAAWNTQDKIKRNSDEWINSKPSSDLDF